jgi:methionyl-tRNA synthetase
MIVRYCGGRVPSPASEAGADVDSRSLIRLCEYLPERVFSATNAFDTPQALGACRDVLDATNQYLERQAPWKHRTGDPQGVNTCLYTAAEALRLVSVLLAPVMPERTAELWRRLGWQTPTALRDGLSWGALQPGTLVTSGEPLFPRL